MLEDRRLAVLRAIVEDFVSTAEPVGSRALAERHALGVSPATVRSDMAALEDAGLITQPHTSAGRIPTDLGYRAFVDHLSTVKPLSSAEQKAVMAFLDGVVTLDEVVNRSVRLLAQLTRQVAVVQYPSLASSVVRHVEVVPVATGRVLLVVITETGAVEQRVVDVGGNVDTAALRDALNAQFVGRSGIDAPAAVPAATPVLTVCSAAVLSALASTGEDRVVMAGTANLTRQMSHQGLDFPQTLRPILEALEEQVVLLRLIDAACTEPTGVRILIGAENTVEGLRSTSVVSTGYGSAERPLGGLGVVGPTRMDYPGTIAAVQAVARYVGDVLDASLA